MTARSGSKALRSFPFVLLLGIGGCGQTVLKKIGEACTTAADCGSNMCKDGRCTVVCTSQNDCPLGFDCGVAVAADAVGNGGAGATCYAATWENVTGGFGTACGVVAADPKGGPACDPNAPSPCAAGFECHSHLRCDPEAYCTKPCAGDLDCPPSMFCGQEVQRTCTSNDDCTGGATCQPTVDGGTVKSCVLPKVCLERGACSDCGTDDQCPKGFVCATGANNNRFCGRVCGSQPDCHQPRNDNMTGSVIGDPFEVCVAAAPGSAVMVCAPPDGLCHGPSTIAAFKSRDHTLCSACRIGVPSDCADGYCYEDDYTKERFCTQVCEMKVVLSGNRYVLDSDDPCPKPTVCMAGVPKTCGDACTIRGVCAAAPPANAIDLTCYPLTK